MSVATRPRRKATTTRSPKTRTTGFRVIEWIELHCVHTQAEWIGRPFVLMDWQKLFILALFAVGADGLRIVRWALLGIAKKNGKTELAAALALYFLIGDGELSPLVVIAAASEEQTGWVFDAVAMMCRRSPTLSQITEVYGDYVLVPSIPGAKLKRVAAAAGTNDGQNIHAVICDELHEWVGRKGRDVWNVLTNGTGARRQPMVLQLTTAGYDLETICGEQYLYGKKVAAGVIKDPRYLFHWIEAEAGADYRSPKVWRQANPSWGVTLPRPMEFFRDQLNRKSEAVFRRYFLNQWTETEEVWEAAALWGPLRSDLELDEALSLFVGIDVGVTHDSSAVAWVQHQEEEGRQVNRAQVWENPHPVGSRMHDKWRFDISLVEDLLRELYAQFPVAAVEDDKGFLIDGPAFYYDPHFFERSAQDLLREGLNMVEYPQSDARMIPASQAFFELIKTGVVAHDGNPDLTRHIRNVHAEQKPRGWRMSKPKGSSKKIDAAIAAAIANFEASRNHDAAPEPTIHVFDEEAYAAKVKAARDADDA